MNPYQDERFETIDALLEWLPHDERKIVHCLRALVLECLPDAAEKMSYNVPFYSRHTRICYIWPASIAWGGHHDGVKLGFVRGNELADDGYLERGKRKAVFTKTFYRTTDIDADRVRALLFEALEADEAAFRHKKAKCRNHRSYNGC